ncbi:NAD(P)/FAD-dependent oxidoreductase [Methanobacterium petrolearium]|uniref:NAD(P)/FAD-dependent oxidoreductase n=1 Tax=Methanobacterium petrolearium TaxID=710190 RepID=UPI001AE23A3D|nr:NAD(P)/FAD-dependent oxidoreductase [Methanobacterium petrolearium]MBP1946491.1 digeranylgeranylglycerophospholipid reductase [Methanobacterium petrolearium]
MLETDVLVIGAGPAGSMAAKHTAMGGAKVLMVDKKSEIGAPKRCAEGVSKDGLKRLEVTPDPRWIASEINKVRLVSPNGTDVLLDEEKVKLSEVGYVLERKVFDKHLAMDAARAGAQIMVKTLATSMKTGKNGITVQLEHMGNPLEIKAKIVIGADGPESRVGRWANLKTGLKPGNMESCAQFEMVGVEMEQFGCIELIFGSVAPGGYAWIFPKGDDMANVGLGVLSNRTEKTAYQHLLEFVDEYPATQNAQPVELNVGGDPVAGLHKELVTDHLLITGDAAGMVNPLDGGGIISGMTGGCIAGEIAAKAIADGDYSKKNLKEYQERCQKEIGDSFKKYLKAKEYLLSLSDDELDSIAKAFNESDFDRISPTDLLKVLVKVSPKAMLKLGKLF